MSEDISIHDAESTDDLLQLVIFQLGGEEFGVEIMQAQEIIRMLGITRIPQSPEYVEGVINLRGKIIVQRLLLFKLQIFVIKKIEGIVIELLFPTPYQTFVICEMLIKMNAVFIVPTVSPCRKYVRHLLGEECQCLFRYVSLIFDIY